MYPIKISIPILLFLFSLSGYSQEIITVDPSKEISQVSKMTVGMNACWLLSSDQGHPSRQHSFEEALKEMGIGSLRFPFGHLADNYLWHTGKWEDAANGLRPKLAAMTEDPSPLARDKWSSMANTDGTFIDDMDFDEYMGICQRLDIEPVIMVNALSWKYEDGPSRAYLIESAKEWVRYANVTKNMNITYWEIGNEVDLHAKKGEVTKQEYFDFYLEITSAMKSVDPTIKVGFGILGSCCKDWYEDILDQSKEEVDFLVAHMYLNSWSTYEDYRDDSGFARLNPLLHAVNSIRTFAPDQNIEVLMTEVGPFSTSGKWSTRDNNLLKAMAFFEQTGRIILEKEVTNYMHWTAHNAFGNNTKTDLRNDATALDLENRVLASGYVHKIWSSFLKTKMVASTLEAGTYLRSFASYDEDSKELSVFILNKKEETLETNVKLENYEGSLTNEKWVFTGTSPEDLYPELKFCGDVKVDSHDFSISLEPYSITVVSFKNKAN